MNIPQAVDLTRNTYAENRITDDLRPIPGTSYPLGTVVQWAAQDSQAWIDYRTVQPSPAVASSPLLAGVIAEDSVPFPGASVTGVLNISVSNRWGGFDGVGGTTSAASGARGTQKVSVTIYGYHPFVLIDQTSAAANGSNGSPVTTSATSAGYGQTIASPVANAMLGSLALPASGIGSALGHGAITQASATVTIASPATGDVYFVTVQISEIQTSPGVIQTRTVSIGPLTAAQATSATTAATQAVAVLNADPVFSRYYVATNSAGVITITALANALYARYFTSAWVNPGTNLNLTPFLISLSGAVGTGLTLTSGTTTGSGTATASGNLAGGAGFKGYAPVFISASL